MRQPVTFLCEVSLLRVASTSGGGAGCEEVDGMALAGVAEDGDGEVDDDASSVLAANEAAGGIGEPGGGGLVERL